MKSKTVLILAGMVILAILTFACFADEGNITAVPEGNNDTVITNSTSGDEGSFVDSENLTDEMPSVPAQPPATDKGTKDQTPPEPVIDKAPVIEDFKIVKFFPEQFNIGDVQFNIQVVNTGNVEIADIVALVSGVGFSAYNTVPIDRLAPQQSSYIIVMGNFKDGGNVSLMVRIKDKIFYKNVIVIDPHYEEKMAIVEQEKLAEAQKKEAELKKELLKNMTVELDVIDANYTAMEDSLRQKKADNYDISEVSLVELKGLMRAARSAILTGDVEDARVNLDLAMDEYNDQFRKLQNAPLIKRSLLDIIRSNLLLISSLAASIITLFTFYEIMKKKQKDLGEKVKQKVDHVRGKIKEKREKDKPNDSKISEDPARSDQEKPQKKGAKKKKSKISGSKS